MIDELEQLYKVMLQEAAPGKPTASANPAGKTGEQIARQAAPMVTAANDTPGSEVLSPSLDAVDEEDLEELDPHGKSFVQRHEGSDLGAFNYKSFTMFLYSCYETKDPFLIYGEPGLGKSEVVKNVCESIAKSKGKKFVSFNDLPEEEKEKLVYNPEDTFALVDVRTVELEPSDFIGIPSDLYGKKPWVDYKQPLWVYYMTRPGADGVLFLDEINQGSPGVLRALYQIVNKGDRTIGRKKYAKDFAVVGAGNLGAEHGNESIPRALTNRFKAGVLITDPEGWYEWAMENNVDMRITSFVKSDPDKNFYAKPTGEDDPFPTPRQLVGLSNDIRAVIVKARQLKKQGKSPLVSPTQEIVSHAVARCGHAWGSAFGVFLEHMRMFDMKQIIKDPDSWSREADVSKKHALIVYVVNQIKNLTRKTRATREKMTPDEMEIIHGITIITNNLSPQNKVILWGGLIKDIPEEDIAFVMNQAVKGNYNAADKERFLKDSIPVIKEMVSKKGIAVPKG